MGMAPLNPDSNVTAIIVLHNNSGLVADLAQTLSHLPVRVVIYDSGSTDGSLEAALELIPGARFITGENLGFGHGNNAAARLVDTEYTLLLNSDARIDSGSLAMLVAHLEENSSTAAAQPLIRAWKWPLVTAGSGVFVTPFGEAWDAKFMHLEREPGSDVLRPPAVSAAVSLWRTSVFHDVGGFDPGYFMYFEDADLCLRASVEGWTFSVLREARALHRVGASSRRPMAARWEVASSVRLAKRFLGGGRLPKGFLARQARIQLRLVLSGKPWAGRFMALVQALNSPVNPIALPARVRPVLHGSPGDYPLPRPGPEGPGVRGRFLAPYGVFPAGGGSIRISSPFDDVSAGICGADGMLRESFTIPRGTGRLVELSGDGGLLYIFCNDPRARLEVTGGEVF